MKKNTNHRKNLSDSCHYHWKNAVHVLGIIILAFLFARFIVCDLMSISVFAPIEKATDFQMSDIYQSVSESKAIHQLSNDITIVSIDGYSRADVLDATNLISEYLPSSIGLDVFFPVPEKDNSSLFATLSDVPNVVCAAMFERDQEGSAFHHIPQSFFEDSLNVTYGYVNLNASSQRDVIRQFVPYTLTAENDTMLSMPAQLAKLCNPKCYKKLLSRGGRSETIAFENIEFPIVPVAEILSGEVDESQLTNKIVLIGDIHNVNDSYLSPLHEPLSGIMLHAYALQTVLSCNYIDTTPIWLNWFMAIIICLLFTICNVVAKYYLGNFGNLFIRIVQFAIIYILINVGSSHFASHHSYIDFSPSVLMIGFGAVAFDVWFGVYALFNLVKNKIFKK